MTRNTEVFDANLNPVLEIANQEELDILVGYFIDKISEDLTSSEPYEKYSPDHTKYADLIAKEIRDYGGNSLANVWRGEGPPYHEIVRDVAKNLKAPFHKDQDIETIEESILATILAKALDQMTDEEKEELLNEIGRANLGAAKGLSVAAFQAIFKAGGFASYKLTVIIANAVARSVLNRGLGLAANRALVKGANFLVGPIGWAITVLWTAIDIAGPSYKVTIPAVVHIAMLRKQYNSTMCPECNSLLGDDSFKFCPECGHSFAL